jgi:EAL domain-containing protein (putative c-di-GMP-specific phosphodiesterase class I)
MPVGTLKIDHSYTREILTSSATRAIVEVVRDLAAKVGLTIIAEGVETDEQRTMLLDMGVTFGQGYLMARPCDEETFLTQYAPLIAGHPALAAAITDRAFG